jgi:L-malate glycosyltransferase
MRILQICSARLVGGGERHLADLANALAGRGHDLYAALIPNSPLRAALHALPEQNIIQLRMRNALDVGSALKLAQFVREHQIQVVHAHVARDYPLAALAARRQPNTRFVITRHVLFPLNKLHRLTLARVSRVIAVSQAVAHGLCKQGLLAQHKIVVIPNGIETSRFVQVSLRIKHESSGTKSSERAQLLVGTVGHLAPIKGYEEFLRAAAVIASRRSDVDFVIVGEDKSRTGRHRAQVERLVAELGLRERVQLTGWLDDVAPTLSSFDVFVSAARIEPFGLAILEAMACGTAIVATETEGAREIVQHGETGLLVPRGDVDALAESVLELLQDKDRRERLGKLAREVVEERFSLERMVDATEGIYRESFSGE